MDVSNSRDDSNSRDASNSSNHKYDCNSRDAIGTEGCLQKMETINRNASIIGDAMK